MRTGTPKAELTLSGEDRAQLQSLGRSRPLPAALGNRARIVLSSADGEPNNSIAGRLKLTQATAGKWRARFIERRIEHFVTVHDANCQPFKWNATADSILEKLHRLCPRIGGTGQKESRARMVGTPGP